MISFYVFLAIWLWTGAWFAGREDRYVRDHIRFFRIADSSFFFMRSLLFGPFTAWFAMINAKDAQAHADNNHQTERLSPGATYHELPQ